MRQCLLGKKEHTVYIYGVSKWNPDANTNFDGKTFYCPVHHKKGIKLKYIWPEIADAIKTMSILIGKTNNAF